MKVPLISLHIVCKAQDSITPMKKKFKISTRLNHWLFQDSCHIAVRTNAGLTVYILTQGLLTTNIDLI